MKRSIRLLYLLMLLSFFSYVGLSNAKAASSADLKIMEDDPLPTETGTDPSPSPTDADSATPEPTATATPIRLGIRPVVVIASYSTKPELITPGKEFSLEIRLVNQGQSSAKSIIMTVPAGNFIPLKTGGVMAVDDLDPGDKQKLVQPLSASSSLLGAGVTTLDVKISYTDDQGQAFSETFTIAVNLTQMTYGGVYATATPTPTPTPVAVNRPQLVISGYQTDVNPLQPGARFSLLLTVVNVGNTDAKRVTMVVGGAALTTNPGNGESNPTQSGGITASGGDFTNFSPDGASNVQSLGDLPVGVGLTAQQSLIVNVTTNPGVYSLKISFAYLDSNGDLLIDDQVISLLVYSEPVIEINLYRDPGPLYAGQPNQVPLQIVNLGRKSVVLGSMMVHAPNGQLMNNSIFVGPLDMGGYFPIDVTWIPDSPGPVELSISVDYTDDFNQTREITRALSLEVMEIPMMDPGVDPGMGPGEDPGMEPPESQPETFWKKVLRFLSGLVGLDSALPTQVPGESLSIEGGGSSGVGSIVVGPPLKGP